VQKEDSESLQVTLLRFAHAMEEVEEYRSVLFMQLHNSLTEPLTEQLKTDSRCAHDSLRRTQKAREAYESSVARVCQQRRGREDANIMRELQESRSAYQRETVDTICELNELQANRKIDCLERICSFMYAQASFYHQAHHLFEELQPYMRAISSDLQATRLRFDQDRREMRERATQIKQTDGRSAPLDPNASTIEGYLYKKGKNRMSAWQRRFFSVRDGSLFVYKPPESGGKERTRALQVANLCLATVKPVTETERRFVFSVVTPDRVITLQTSTAEDYQAWVTTLQNAIKQSLDGQFTPRKNEGSSETYNTRSSANKSSPQLQRVFEMSASNRLCADCGRADPDWASINLGVTVCIECSGVHRSLGTHISKVRSLTLDAWDSELMELFGQLGNEKVNAVFAAMLPPDRMLDSQADRAVRELFIRDKYERRVFVSDVGRRKDADGSTLEPNAALYEAVTHDSLIDALHALACGANINYQEPGDKRTSLHVAITNENFVMCEFLFQNGANVDLSDCMRWSPLHHAAFLGHTAAAGWLFKRSARLDLKDRTGKTPVEIAAENQNADCVTLLRIAQLALEENPKASQENESFVRTLEAFTGAMRPQPTPEQDSKKLKEIRSCWDRSSESESDSDQSASSHAEDPVSDDVDGEVHDDPLPKRPAPSVKSATTTTSSSSSTSAFSASIASRPPPKDPALVIDI